MLVKDREGIQTCTLILNQHMYAIYTDTLDSLNLMTNRSVDKPMQEWDQIDIQLLRDFRPVKFERPKPRSGIPLHIFVNRPICFF